jgi:hypothetical protein
MNALIRVGALVTREEFKRYAATIGDLPTFLRDE